jgi:hypothetical protein
MDTRLMRKYGCFFLLLEKPLTRQNDGICFNCGRLEVHKGRIYGTEPLTRKAEPAKAELPCKKGTGTLCTIFSFNHFHNFVHVPTVI